MTAEMIDLLPPPMELVLGSSATDALPRCTPNLMPFHIDYDGPAPVDAFLLLRVAPSDDRQEHSGSIDSAGPLTSFVSAFRGRAIQSTSLPLPSGYRADLVRIAQVEAPAHAQSSTSSVSQSTRQDEQERQRKRQKTARMPAKQQRFSMDSDDEDEEHEEQSEDVSPEPEGEQQQDMQPMAGRVDERAAARVRIAPIARVADDELRIWGPDGPVDRGDDTLFRTIGEWMTSVAPILHS